MGIRRDGARWSPDGLRIAFISNRGGSTEIWLQDMLGGAQRKLEIREKKYLHPRGALRIQTLDGLGRPIAARIAVTSANGLAYAPEMPGSALTTALIVAAARSRHTTSTRAVTLSSSCLSALRT